MTLKKTWANGEQFNASDMNELSGVADAAYVKPGTGIPATDLASAVQTSLGKADTAVQSVSSTNITDATTTGKAVLTAANASSARTTLGTAYGSTAGTVCEGNDSRLSPTSNSLTDATTVGKALITATDAPTARTTLGVAYGTSSTTVCVGNDSRLSDTRDVANTNTVTVKAANLTIQDGTDTTKQAQFVASGITTATTRSYTLPDSSVTLVGQGTALGTPASGTLTNCTGLPVAGITASTSTALGVGTVELGHASDTTLSRSAAGVLAVEGVDVVTTSGTQTLTNKTTTNPTITNYTESVVANGTKTTSHTFDLTSGTVQTVTLTASTACTFTMPTATAGKSFIVLLKQASSTGNGTATFTGVKWNSSGAPTITATAGKMDILSFVADGTNWYGSYSQGYTY